MKRSRFTGQQIVAALKEGDAGMTVRDGPEFLADVFVDWCKANQVEPRYIQPGKPNQNALVERFNRTYREEVLDAYLFESLVDVHRITEAWTQEYNEEQPHDAIGCTPPSEFRRQIEAKVSTLKWFT
jgi:putative transposase